MANYTSDYYFKINGVSSNEYGIFVDTLQPVPHAQQRYTTGTTREPYGIPDDVFEPISYYISFYKFFPESMDDSTLRAFLVNGTVLQLSNYPDIYFKILTMNVIEVSGMHDNRRIDYRLSFALAPFRYGLENDWVTLSKGDTIENIGTWFSKPLIELYKPFGTITITINNVDYEFRGMTHDGGGSRPGLDHVFIDSQRLIVYNGENEMYIGRDDGRYPRLEVGENTISWSGEVETVKIKVNWREI